MTCLTPARRATSCTVSNDTTRSSSLFIEPRICTRRSVLNTSTSGDCDRSVTSMSVRPVRSQSISASPVLFSKYITATEGRDPVAWATGVCCVE